MFLDSLLSLSVGVGGALVILGGLLLFDFLRSERASERQAKEKRRLLGLQVWVLTCAVLGFGVMFLLREAFLEIALPWHGVLAHAVGFATTILIALANPVLRRQLAAGSDERSEGRGRNGNAP